MSDKHAKHTVTVRLVHDTREGRYWFEEKLDSGQWVEIPCTNMACEGNSRHNLEKELERRRQARLAIHRNISAEQTFEI